MDTMGPVFAGTPFTCKGIGRLPRVAPEFGLLSRSQVWASNAFGKFSECYISPKTRHSPAANSSFSTSRMSPNYRTKSRNAKQKTHAKKRVGDSSTGDEVNDHVAREDPPRPSLTVNNGGGNEIGAEMTASLPLNSISTTENPFGGNVDASSSDMVDSGPDTPEFSSEDEDNSFSADEEDNLKSRKASLANVDIEASTSSGVNVDDLVIKIEEAEKNIRLLDRVHALEGQLTEARREIKSRESRNKNTLLEGDLEALDTHPVCEASVPEAVRQAKVEFESPQNHSENLTKSLEQLGGNELSRTNEEVYEREIRMLEQPGGELQANEDVADQHIAGERESQDHACSLKFRLNPTEQEDGNLMKMDANEAESAEERRLSPTEVEISNQCPDSELLDEKEALRNQLQILQELLKKAEVNKDALISTRAENIALLERVRALQEHVVKLDARIPELEQEHQQQLEILRKSLEKLKAERDVGMAQVPAVEMPWEFWSDLLLRIDALQLGKHISLEDAQELRVMAWRRESSIRDRYAALKSARDVDLLAGLSELTKRKKEPGYYVVHIAAEMAPVAKVGGLGDVVTGLGKALQKKGHLVEIILPKYDCMDYSRIKDLKVLDVELYSYFDHQTHKNKIWLGIVEGLPVYFIEPHHHERFFWRGRFYGEDDDFRRFTYFCRAALEFLLQSGKRPDMIHSHDWQTAAVAPLYWDNYVPQGMDSARLAFTCHNFEHQGTESPAALASCGLNVQQLHRQDRMQDNYNFSQINLLKAGVVFSNVVTTVSPTYAQEARAPEGGRGLHLTLAHHSKKFVGILNGIDDEAWNPATDQLLPFHFSSDDLGGKAANKTALRSRLRLALTSLDEDRPLVAVITRLVPQKGVHLIRHAIYRTLQLGGQFVLLGSSPIPSIQNEFEGIAKDFENHPHICLVLEYDEGLSHSIYAASDVFVIPSIFEPCGLTQMVSMRYGSIPVVRKTGGLADSVFDVDDPSIPEEKKNGFTFAAADVSGLNYALDRALDYYSRNKVWWEKLVKKAMKLDFSWDISADRYVDLYRLCIERAKVHG